MYKILFFIFIHFGIYAAEPPDPKAIHKSKDTVFFLSTPKSGSNLISGSLSAITRKPISWINWGREILDENSPNTRQESYNRLGLPLITNTPLLYRTHYDFDKLKKAPYNLNKLIFVTRNPKELLFRKFFLLFPSKGNPDPEFIDTFLDQYLETFSIYNSWFPNNRYLVFYEDFLKEGDKILLELLEFMEEEPTYLEDFLNNKDTYLSQLLDSYRIQHEHNSRGSSSLGGSKPIHYSKNAPFEILAYIDAYLEKADPASYEKHFKRFQSFKEE